MGFSFLCRGGGWWGSLAPAAGAHGVLLPVPWWWLVGVTCPSRWCSWGSPSCAVGVLGGRGLPHPPGLMGLSFRVGGGGRWGRPAPVAGAHVAVVAEPCGSGAGASTA